MLLPDLIDRLETERQKFTEGPFALTVGQQSNLKECAKLVKAAKITRNTPKRRMQDFLKDVWNFDEGVYLLCAISTTTTKLRQLQGTSYLVSISRWWRDKDHPRELDTVKEKYKLLLPSATGSRRFEGQSSKAEVGESLVTNNLTIRQTDLPGNGTPSLPQPQLQNAINGGSLQSTLQHAQPTSWTQSDINSGSFNSSLVPISGFDSDCYPLSLEDAYLALREIHRVPTAEIRLTVPHPNATTSGPFMTIPVSLDMIQILTQGKIKLFAL